MAQLVLDSCGDHYRTAQLAEIFPQVVGSPTVTASGRSGYGITGPSNAWYVVPQGVLALAHQSPTQILYIGMAVKLPSAVNCQFINMAGWHLSLNVDPTGDVYCYDGYTVAYLTTPSGTFKFGGWNYLEVSFGISSAGVVSSILRVNGYQVGSGTSTSFDVGNVAVQIGDTNNSTGGTLIIDDLYIYDHTGTDHNNFASKLFNIIPKIIVSPPSGDGRITQLTPTGLASNWANAANIPPVEGSDYNGTATIGHADAYAMTPPTFNGIYGVQAKADLSQSDPSGTRSVSLGIGNGSTETYNSPIGLTDQFTFYTSQFPLDPNTGSAWTTAGFNAAQAAIQLAT